MDQDGLIVENLHPADASHELSEHLQLIERLVVAKPMSVPGPSRRSDPMLEPLPVYPEERTSPDRPKQKQIWI